MLVAEIPRINFLELCFSCRRWLPKTEMIFPNECYGCDHVRSDAEPMETVDPPDDHDWYA